MYEIVFIRENCEFFKSEMAKRGVSISVIENLLALDKNIRELKSRIQNLQHKKKLNARQDFDKEKVKEIGLSIKKEIAILERDESNMLEKLNDSLSRLPNILDRDVPKGYDEKSNIVIRSFGEPRDFSFHPKSHDKLGENLGMMDFSSAVKLSGSRFVVLRKDLAKLERALANFMLDIHVNEFGYEEISPPYIVNEDIMFKAGQLPKFNHDSFKASNDKRLIPTSEVPLVCMLSNKIYSEVEFPMRYTAFTPCFRSEAGSAGKDTKGMIRLHQFSKVELVSAVLPEKSNHEHERMTSVAEEVLKRLDLPYRVSILCSGDTGFCAKKTYDIEVWLPFQAQYREISSCSNCGDFQSVRMKGKYKSIKDNKNKFFHTLNGSALAVGRTIVAILENYQNQDGSIMLPDKLQSYMSGQKIIEVFNE